MVDINREHLANKVLLMLIEKAHNHQTTTYQEIALKFGLPSSGNALAGAVGPILGIVFKWCEQVGIPPITVLVVRKSGTHKDLPGSGFWQLIKHNADWNAYGSDGTDIKKLRGATEFLQHRVYEFFDMS